MATVNSTTTSDTSAFAGRSLLRWPAYATKEACLLDLQKCVQGRAIMVEEVMQRLSNTDTSGWTDKGSRVN